MQCYDKHQTSVSETIWKPPLIKAQTALITKKYGEKRFSIWWMELLHPAMWHDYDIDFARWLHPAMWHVALESWQWIYQVAAPCNVIRGSWMTSHWIHPLAAPCNVTQLWDHDIEFARWQVTLGWHSMEFAQTSAILEFYIWFRFWPYHHSQHVILHQSAKFYPNKTTLGRKKWRHVDFQDGGSQPSWILGVPCTISYRSSIATIALNWCLVFEKIAFFLHFGDRQTDRQTDGQHRCTVSLLSHHSLLILITTNNVTQRDYFLWTNSNATL